MIVSLERFARGLASRTRRLKSRQRLQPATDQSSLFTSLEVQRLGRAEALLRPDVKWLAVSTASRAPTLAAQLQSLEFLARAGELHLARSYAVGVLFGGGNGSDEPSDDLSDEDYSILVEAQLRAGHINDHETGRRLHVLVRGLISSIPDAPASPDPLGQIAARFRRLVPSRPMLSVQDLRRFLTQLKRAYVHLIGPDIITALQVLSDPAVKLTREQLDLTFELLDDWGLVEPGYALLLMRLLGPYPVEQRFLRDRQSEVRDLFGPQSAGRIARVFNGDPSFVDDFDIGETFAQTLLAAFEGLAFALAAESAADVHQALIKVFLRDPALVDFLPWRDILQVVEQVSLSSPQALFVTMLMRKRSVQQLHRVIAWRIGDGGFIGDTTRFVLANRKPDILGMFARLRDLPPPAAEALARAILEPQIFEKIVGAFLSRPALGELASAGDNVHLMRIDAIREARRRQLIAPLFARVEMDAEREKAKLHHLEMNLRLGRVRIPHEAISAATAATMSGLPLELIDSGVSAQPNDDVVQRAAAYIAQGVAAQVLFDSPVSINQGLSNNLRHGIVVPRILRAFDDSLHLAHLSRDEMPQWQEAKLSMYFGGDAAEIIAFRESVNDTLKNLQEDLLVVRRDDSLDVQLRSQIEHIVSGRLVQGSDHETLIAAEICAAVEDEVREFLATAARTLTEVTLPALLEKLSGLRWTTKGREVAFTKMYLDSLETTLSQAAEEVATWIAIADRDEALPFRLDDLVNLELRTSVLNDWRRLKVDTRCIDTRRPAESRPLLDGRYFELFQSIVHNLISNSYKYSGLENRTQIMISLSYSGDQLRIRCANDIAPDHVAKLQREHDATARHASSTATTGRDKDKLSGFIKIRGAFVLSMDRSPSIVIPPIAERRQAFVVEIVIKSPPEIFHVASQDSDRRG